MIRRDDDGGCLDIRCLSRAEVDIIFANMRIYDISYFNLLKENGVPRLVAGEKEMVGMVF